MWEDNRGWTGGSIFIDANMDILGRGDGLKLNAWYLIKPFFNVIYLFFTEGILDRLYLFVSFHKILSK